MHSALSHPHGPSKPTIEQVVAGTPDLPVMPAAVMKVIQLTGSPDATAALVGEALGVDQALAARVLKLANSAYYGLHRSVASLKEAVVILGFSSIRNMAMLASASPWLKKPLPGYELPPNALILHSLGVATGAKMLAKLAHKPEIADQAFIGGLLCDIGKIALSRFLTDKVATMVSLGQQAGMTFNEVESRVMGFDHCEVGAYMADSWKLPENVVMAIRYHHDPNSAPDHKELCDCVHIANFLTITCGFGMGGDGLCYEFCPESLQRLGLESEDLDRIVNDFVVAYEHHESVLKELAG